MWRNSIQMKPFPVSQELLIRLFVLVAEDHVNSLELWGNVDEVLLVGARFLEH
jgi:hypothetical protein